MSATKPPKDKLAKSELHQFRYGGHRSNAHLTNRQTTSDTRLTNSEIGVFTVAIACSILTVAFGLGLPLSVVGIIAFTLLPFLAYMGIKTWQPLDAAKPEPTKRLPEARVVKTADR